MMEIWISAFDARDPDSHLLLHENSMSPASAGGSSKGMSEHSCQQIPLGWLLHLTAQAFGHILSQAEVVLIWSGMVSFPVWHAHAPTAPIGLGATGVAAAHAIFVNLHVPL